jgi:hypothetical protein
LNEIQELQEGELRNQAKEIVKGEEMITLFTVNTFQKLGTFPKMRCTTLTTYHAD